MPNLFDKIADEAADTVDKKLEQHELEVLTRTSIDWEALRPQVTDQDAFNRLMAAVNASTKNNESKAQLKNRLQALGTEGLAVAKRVASLVSPIV